MKAIMRLSALAGIAGFASAVSAATLEVGANRPYRTISADRRYSVKNAPQPHFKPVDTARLGKNALGHQPFENRDGTPYVWDAEHSPAREPYLVDLTEICYIIPQCD